MKAIRDLINGNLTDAKKAARNRSFFSIYTAAMDEYGMTDRTAVNMASYLKGDITWQQYCQEKHALTYVS